MGTRSEGLMKYPPTVCAIVRFSNFSFSFFFSVRTFVCLSIYLFVRLTVSFFIRLFEFFLRNYPSNFSNFCVIQFKNWQSWVSLKKLFDFLDKVPQAYRLKTNLKMNFWGKIMFGGFLVERSPKWAQNEVFQVSSKIASWNLSEFLHKLTVT